MKAILYSTIFFLIFISFSNLVKAQILITENFDAVPLSSGQSGILYGGWTSLSLTGTDPDSEWDLTNPYGACCPFIAPNGPFSTSGSNCVEYDAMNIALPGNSAALISPRFNLSTGSGTAYPSISFEFFRNAGNSASDNIQVYANTNPSMLGAILLAEAVTLSTIIHRDWQSIPVGSLPNQWYSYTYNLPAAFSTGSAYFIIVGMGGGGGHSMYIDDIQIPIGDKNVITGKSFLDANQNSVYDSGESGFNLGHINSANQSTTYYSVPGNNGNYYNLVDSGSWTSSFVPHDTSYFTVIPNFHNSSFGNQFNQLDTINFAVQLIPGHPDLCIEIIPLSPARAGFDVNYRLIATNVGTDTISGDLQYTHDSLISLISTLPLFDTYTNPVISWNFNLIAPFQTLTYDVTLNIPAPPTINIGDTLSSSVVINPVITDEHPNNNFSAIGHEVTGSYDPNDKWVNLEVIADSALPFSEYLTYLIRFQNTGTDTAFGVVIRDTLNYQLDQSTLQILHSSHDYLVFPRDSNVLEFQFNNILLPDSNVNEPESHGYIAYQIKPKNTLAVGDKIHNRAAIYFDYNPPILTNRVTTEVVLITSISELNGALPLTIYPNPTDALLTISANGLQWKNTSISLYNTLGQLVLDREVNSLNSNEYTLDVSTLSTGMYQLVVLESDRRYSAKVLVE